MKRINLENINTIKYWDNVYKNEWDNDYIRININLCELLTTFFNDDESIIDVGCGSGGILKYLSENKPNCELTGLEQSKIGIEYAKKVCQKATYYEKFEELKDKKFDVVICSETLEHISDNYSFMDKILHITKNNGTIITTTPFGWSDLEKEHLWDYECFKDILNLTRGKCKLTSAIVINNQMVVVMEKVGDV
jgi:2-polyprenyl-3-methyl-5-hydroxy-6-metoxy-1,4-benzoquinol methylase